MPELLLVVAEFLTEEEERRPAPEDIADSLRVDPARPLLNELEDEGLVVGEIKKITGTYYGFWPDDGAKGGRMLVGLCALKMNGSTIEAVIDDDMDSDDLDNFMDAYDGIDQATSNV